MEPLGKSNTILVKESAFPAGFPKSLSTWPGALDPG